MREKTVQIERKFFIVKGPHELAMCIKENETDGFNLSHLIWSGNIEVSNAPGQVLTAKGDKTRHGIIHLYLVMFVREKEIPVAKVVN